MTSRSKVALLPLLFLSLTLPRLDAFAQRTSCAAFVDVTVVPMNANHLLPHQDVVVERTHISEFGPSGRIALPSNCEVIEGRHRYLIPGIVDSHLHLPLKGLPDQRLVLAMLLANGITTAINMEGSTEILSLRDQIARGEVSGPRLYTTGQFIQQPAFMTADQVRAEVIAEKRAGYDFIKIHGDLTKEAYDALTQTAREQSIRVVGHLPSNLGIDAALNAHQALIVHAEEYLYAYFQFHRALPADSKEIEQMVREISRKTKDAGTWVSPTLSVFRQIISQAADIDAVLQRPEMRYMPRHLTTGDAVGAKDFAWYPPDNPYVKRWPLDKIPYLRAQYALLQRLTRGLRDAGVPLLAGTDPFVPCVIPGFSMKDELEQLYEAGLTPFEVLQAATSNAARFLGTSDWGTIEKGKVADLVLLDANPLSDVMNIFRQDGVMLRGHWFPEAELQAELAKSVPAN